MSSTPPSNASGAPVAVVQPGDQASASSLPPVIANASPEEAQKREKEEETPAVKGGATATTASKSFVKLNLRERNRTISRHATRLHPVAPTKTEKTKTFLSTANTTSHHTRPSRRLGSGSNGGHPPHHHHHHQPFGHKKLAPGSTDDDDDDDDDEEPFSTRGREGGPQCSTPPFTTSAEMTMIHQRRQQEGHASNGAVDAARGDSSPPFHSPPSPLSSSASPTPPPPQEGLARPASPEGEPPELAATAKGKDSSPEMRMVMMGHTGALEEAKETESQPPADDNLHHHAPSPQQQPPPPRQNSESESDDFSYHSTSTAQRKSSIISTGGLPPVVDEGIVVDDEGNHFVYTTKAATPAAATTTATPAADAAVDDSAVTDPFANAEVVAAKERVRSNSFVPVFSFVSNRPRRPPLVKPPNPSLKPPRTHCIASTHAVLAAQEAFHAFYHEQQEEIDVDHHHLVLAAAAATSSDDEDNNNNNNNDEGTEEEAKEAMKKSDAYLPPRPAATEAARQEEANEGKEDPSPNPAAAAASLLSSRIPLSSRARPAQLPVRRPASAAAAATTTTTRDSGSIAAGALTSKRRNSGTAPAAAAAVRPSSAAAAGRGPESPAPAWPPFDGSTGLGRISAASLVAPTPVLCPVERKVHALLHQRPSNPYGGGGVGSPAVAVAGRRRATTNPSILPHHHKSHSTPEKIKKEKKEKKKKAESKKKTGSGGKHPHRHRHHHHHSSQADEMAIDPQAVRQHHEAAAAAAVEEESKSEEEKRVDQDHENNQVEAVEAVVEADAVSQHSSKPEAATSPTAVWDSTTKMLIPVEVSPSPSNDHTAGVAEEKAAAHSSSPPLVQLPIPTSANSSNGNVASMGSVPAMGECRKLESVSLVDDSSLSHLHSPPAPARVSAGPPPAPPSGRLPGAGTDIATVEQTTTHSNGIDQPSSSSAPVEGENAQHEEGDKMTHPDTPLPAATVPVVTPSQSKGEIGEEEVAAPATPNRGNKESETPLQEDRSIPARARKCQMSESKPTRNEKSAAAEAGRKQKAVAESEAEANPTAASNKTIPTSKQPFGAIRIGPATVCTRTRTRSTPHRHRPAATRAHTTTKPTTTTTASATTTNDMNNNNNNDRTSSENEGVSRMTMKNGRPPLAGRCPNPRTALQLLRGVPLSVLQQCDDVTVHRPPSSKRTAAAGPMKAGVVRGTKIFLPHEKQQAITGGGDVVGSSSSSSPAAGMNKNLQQQPQWTVANQIGNGAQFGPVAMNPSAPFSINLAAEMMSNTNTATTTTTITTTTPTTPQGLLLSSGHPAATTSNTITPPSSAEDMWYRRARAVLAEHHRVTAAAAMMTATAAMGGGVPPQQLSVLMVSPYAQLSPRSMRYEETLGGQTSPTRGAGAGERTMYAMDGTAAVLYSVSTPCPLPKYFCLGIEDGINAMLQTTTGLHGGGDALAKGRRARRQLLSSSADAAADAASKGRRRRQRRGSGAGGISGSGSGSMSHRGFSPNLPQRSTPERQNGYNNNNNSGGGGSDSPKPHLFYQNYNAYLPTSQARPVSPSSSTSLCTPGSPLSNAAAAFLPFTYLAIDIMMKEENRDEQDQDVDDASSYSNLRVLFPRVPLTEVVRQVEMDDIARERALLDQLSDEDEEEEEEVAAAEAARRQRRKEKQKAKEEQEKNNNDNNNNNNASGGSSSSAAGSGIRSILLLREQHQQQQQQPPTLTAAGSQAPTADGKPVAGESENNGNNNNNSNSSSSARPFSKSGIGIGGIGGGLSPRAPTSQRGQRSIAILTESMTEEMPGAKDMAARALAQTETPPPPPPPMPAAPNKSDTSPVPPLPAPAASTGNAARAFTSPPSSPTSSIASSSYGQPRRRSLLERLTQRRERRQRRKELAALAAKKEANYSPARPYFRNAEESLTLHPVDVEARLFRVTANAVEASPYGPHLVAVHQQHASQSAMSTSSWRSPPAGIGAAGGAAESSSSTALLPAPPHHHHHHSRDINISVPGGRGSEREFMIRPLVDLSGNGGRTTLPWWHWWWGGPIAEERDVAFFILQYQQQQQQQQEQEQTGGGWNAKNRVLPCGAMADGAPGGSSLTGAASASLFFLSEEQRRRQRRMSSLKHTFQNPAILGVRFRRWPQRFLDALLRMNPNIAIPAAAGSSFSGSTTNVSPNTHYPHGADGPYPVHPQETALTAQSSPITASSLPFIPSGSQQAMPLPSSSRYPHPLLPGDASMALQKSPSGATLSAMPTATMTGEDDHGGRCGQAPLWGGEALGTSASSYQFPSGTMDHPHHHTSSQHEWNQHPHHHPSTHNPHPPSTTPHQSHSSPSSSPQVPPSQANAIYLGGPYPSAQYSPRHNGAGPQPQPSYHHFAVVPHATELDPPLPRYNSISTLPSVNTAIQIHSGLPMMNSFGGNSIISGGGGTGAGFGVVSPTIMVPSQPSCWMSDNKPRTPPGSGEVEASHDVNHPMLLLASPETSSPPAPAPLAGAVPFFGGIAIADDAPPLDASPSQKFRKGLLTKGAAELMRHKAPGSGNPIGEVAEAIMRDTPLIPGLAGLDGPVDSAHHTTAATAAPGPRADLDSVMMNSTTSGPPGGTTATAGPQLTSSRVVSDSPVPIPPVPVPVPPPPQQQQPSQRFPYDPAAAAHGGIVPASLWSMARGGQYDYTGTGRRHTGSATQRLPYWRRYCTAIALYLALGQAGIVDVHDFPFLSVGTTTWGSVVRSCTTRVEMLRGGPAQRSLLRHALAHEGEEIPVAVQLTMPLKGALHSLPPLFTAEMPVLGGRDLASAGGQPSSSSSSSSLHPPQPEAEEDQREDEKTDRYDRSVAVVLPYSSKASLPPPAPAASPREASPQEDDDGVKTTTRPGMPRSDATAAASPISDATDHHHQHDNHNLNHEDEKPSTQGEKGALEEDPPQGQPACSNPSANPPHHHHQHTTTTTTPRGRKTSTTSSTGGSSTSRQRSPARWRTAFLEETASGGALGVVPAVAAAYEAAALQCIPSTANPPTATKKKSASSACPSRRGSRVINHHNNNNSSTSRRSSPSPNPNQSSSSVMIGGNESAPNMGGSAVPPYTLAEQPYLEVFEFSDAELFQLYYLQLVFRAYFDIRFPAMTLQLPPPPANPTGSSKASNGSATLDLPSKSTTTSACRPPTSASTTTKHQPRSSLSPERGGSPPFVFPLSSTTPPPPGVLRADYIGVHCSAERGIAFVAPAGEIPMNPTMHAIAACFQQQQPQPPQDSSQHINDPTVPAEEKAAEGLANEPKDCVYFPAGSSLLYLLNMEAVIPLYATTMELEATAALPLFGSPPPRPPSSCLPDSSESDDDEVERIPAYWRQYYQRRKNRGKKIENKEEEDDDVQQDSATDHDDNEDDDHFSCVPRRRRTSSCTSASGGGGGPHVASRNKKKMEGRHRRRDSAGMSSSSRRPSTVGQQQQQKKTSKATASTASAMRRRRATFPYQLRSKGGPLFAPLQCWASEVVVDSPHAAAVALRQLFAIAAPYYGASLRTILLQTSAVAAAYSYPLSSPLPLPLTGGRTADHEDAARDRDGSNEKEKNIIDTGNQLEEEVHPPPAKGDDHQRSGNGADRGGIGYAEAAPPHQGPKSQHQSSCMRGVSADETFLLSVASKEGGGPTSSSRRSEGAAIVAAGVDQPAAAEASTSSSSLSSPRSDSKNSGGASHNSESSGDGASLSSSSLSTEQTTTTTTGAVSLPSSSSSAVVIRPPLPPPPRIFFCDEPHAFQSLQAHSGELEQFFVPTEDRLLTPMEEAIAARVAARISALFMPPAPSSASPSPTTTGKTEKRDSALHRDTAAEAVETAEPTLIASEPAVVLENSSSVLAGGSDAPHRGRLCGGDDATATAVAASSRSASSRLSEGGAAGGASEEVFAVSKRLLASRKRRRASQRDDDGHLADAVPTEASSQMDDKNRKNPIETEEEVVRPLFPAHGYAEAHMVVSPPLPISHPAPPSAASSPVMDGNAVTPTIMRRVVRMDDHPPHPSDDSPAANGGDYESPASELTMIHASPPHRSPHHPPPPHHHDGAFTTTSVEYEIGVECSDSVRLASVVLSQSASMQQAISSSAAAAMLVAAAAAGMPVPTTTSSTCLAVHSHTTTTTSQIVDEGQKVVEEDGPGDADPMMADAVQTDEVWEKDNTILAAAAAAESEGGVKAKETPDDAAVTTSTNGINTALPPWLTKHHNCLFCVAHTNATDEPPAAETQPPTKITPTPIMTPAGSPSEPALAASSEGAPVPEQVLEEELEKDDNASGKNDQDSIIMPEQGLPLQHDPSPPLHEREAEAEDGLVQLLGLSSASSNDDGGEAASPSLVKKQKKKQEPPQQQKTVAAPTQATTSPKVVEPASTVSSSAEPPTAAAAAAPDEKEKQEEDAEETGIIGKEKKETAVEEAVGKDTAAAAATALMMVAPSASAFDAATVSPASSRSPSVSSTASATLLQRRFQAYVESGDVHLFDGDTSAMEITNEGVPLGQGGSGVVFQGVYGPQRLPVAIKVFILPSDSEASQESYVRESLTDVAFYVLLNALDDAGIAVTARAHTFIVSDQLPKGLPVALVRETIERLPDSSTATTTTEMDEHRSHRPLCYFVTDLMDGTLGRFLTEDDEDYDPWFAGIQNDPLRPGELFQFLYIQLVQKIVYDWTMLDMMLNGELRGDNIGVRYLKKLRYATRHQNPNSSTSLLLLNNTPRDDEATRHYNNNNNNNNNADDNEDEGGERVEPDSRQYYKGLLIGYHFSSDEPVRYLHFSTEEAGQADLRFILFMDLGQGIQPDVVALTERHYIGDTVVSSCVEDDGLGRYWPLDELYCRGVEVEGELASEVVQWGRALRLRTREDALAALRQLFEHFEPQYGVGTNLPLSAEERARCVRIMWGPEREELVRQRYVYQSLQQRRTEEAMPNVEEDEQQREERSPKKAAE